MWRKVDGVYLGFILVIMLILAFIAGYSFGVDMYG